MPELPWGWVKTHHPNSWFSRSEVGLEHLYFEQVPRGYSSRFCRETEPAGDIEIRIYRYRHIAGCWERVSARPIVGKLATQESQWYKLQARYNSEGRRRSIAQHKDRQRDRSPSYADFLFYSSFNLAAWSSPLPNLRRAICFSQPTDSNVNFIQKHCIEIPRTICDQISGNPMGQPGWCMKLTIITQVVLLLLVQERHLENH